MAILLGTEEIDRNRPASSQKVRFHLEIRFKPQIGHSVLWANQIETLAKKVPTFDIS